MLICFGSLFEFIASSLKNNRILLYFIADGYIDGSQNQPRLVTKGSESEHLKRTCTCIILLDHVPDNFAKLPDVLFTFCKEYQMDGL